MSVLAVAFLSLLTQQSPLLETKQKYVPSDQKPEDVARDIDLALASAKNLEGRSALDAITPLTRRAHSEEKHFIVSPSKFHVEYFKLPATHSDQPGLETMIGLNGKYLTYSANGSKPLQPMANRPELPANLLQAWPIKFTQYVFLGIGTKVRPISALVQAAKSAGLDVHVVTLKNPPSAGKKHTVSAQDRIVITRKPADVSRLGSFEINVTVARPSNHLMMISNTIRPLKGAPTFTTWSSQWRTNTVADRKLFQVPVGLGKK